MYTIKSVSNEGIWYLINGWWKYKAYWQERDNCTLFTMFSRPQDAKRSLTKLLKYMMAEYGDDDFTLVKFDYDENGCCYSETEIEKIIIDR